MPHKFVKKHAAPKGKDHPAMKGLKAAHGKGKGDTPTHSGQQLYKESPKMKPKELTDPTLGLKNAIKLKGVEALALRAAGI